MALESTSAATVAAVRTRVVELGRTRLWSRNEWAADASGDAASEAASLPVAGGETTGLTWRVMALAFWSRNGEPEDLVARIGPPAGRHTRAETCGVCTTANHWAHGNHRIW